MLHNIKIFGKLKYIAISLRRNKIKVEAQFMIFGRNIIP
jgi:hypothetical protein